MESVCFASLLILFCVCSAFCFPSRPLNERSPELAWQAWLLVDDQNQNKQQHDADGVLRRRITPKSVFIAPTFSPDSLPPCADGYRSDPMGRCIKIIKIDEAAQLEFLLQKLNEKFGDNEKLDNDYDYEEEEQTPGPFQVNIPLSGGDNEDKGDELETDIAIVVAPTNANFEMSGNAFKLDKRDEQSQKDDKDDLDVSGTKNTLVQLGSVETTTEDISSTTGLDSTTYSSTTADDSTDETTTMNWESTTFEDAEETTTDFSTTTEEEEVPSTTLPPQEETTLLPTPQQLSATTPELPITTPNLHKPFRFPLDEKVEPPTLLDIVRFPDSFDRIPNDLTLPHHQSPSTRDTSKQYAQFFNNKDTGAIFKQDETESSSQKFNHRSRDRHNSMFLLPPRWSQSSPQKPLVLRFSRKHAYVDTQQFKHPDFYRSVQSDDLSYIFGYKHRQRQFNNNNR